MPERDHIEALCTGFDLLCRHKPLEARQAILPSIRVLNSQLFEATKRVPDLKPVYRRVYVTPTDFLYVMQAQFVEGTSLDGVTVLGWNKYFRDESNSYTLIGSLVRHSKQYGPRDAKIDDHSVNALAMLATVVAIKQWTGDKRALLIKVPSSNSSTNKLPQDLVERIAMVGVGRFERAPNHALERVRQYGPLKELTDRTDRVFTVKNSMSADKAIVGGRNILILDDVLESGSTLRECARALKQAGAVSVHAITLETTRRFGQEIMNKK